MEELTRGSGSQLLLPQDGGESGKQDNAAERGNSRPHIERLVCDVALRLPVILS
jgi:hypothetical protein